MESKRKYEVTELWKWKPRYQGNVDRIYSRLLEIVRHVEGTKTRARCLPEYLLHDIAQIIAQKPAGYIMADGGDVPLSHQYAAYKTKIAVTWWRHSRGIAATVEASRVRAHWVSRGSRPGIITVRTEKHPHYMLDACPSRFNTYISLYTFYLKKKYPQILLPPNVMRIVLRGRGFLVVLASPGTDYNPRYFLCCREGYLELAPSTDHEEASVLNSVLRRLFGRKLVNAIADMPEEEFLPMFAAVEASLVQEALKAGGGP